MTEIPKISRPANDALDAAGLTTLEQVARRPRSEVAALHGMGPKGIRILTEAMERAGLGPWKERS
jgi:3-deoxy-D-arabino-heptulosonate 7-phosphate (DAHP) synthase